MKVDYSSNQFGTMDLDLDLPRIDDNVVLPEAEAFPIDALEAPAGSGNLALSSRVHREQGSSEPAETPPQRKRRAPKRLPVDERQELHNTDLTQWNNDYTANMADATAAKISRKAPFLAKKNAAFWVLGVGIGGVGAGLGSSKFQSPLGIFAGDSMMEALTGIKIYTSGQKRGRDDEDDHDSDSETRRTRMRDGDWDQIGRGNGKLDDDGIMADIANNVRSFQCQRMLPMIEYSVGNRSWSQCSAATRRSIYAMEYKLSYRLSSRLNCSWSWY